MSTNKTERIKIDEEKEKSGVVSVAWLLDLNVMPATTQQLLTIIILKGDGIPSREYTYELSWSFQNISEWKQQQGFHRKYSKEIQFCVKKLNEDRRADVISDYWASPETVWVDPSRNGGTFEIDGSKKTITRIILKKVIENVSSDNTKIAEESWKSEQVVFTPYTQSERFIFKFSLQFNKTLSSNRIDSSCIVEQTTNYLFLQQTNCDVHFCFQGNTRDKIGAHRFILSARSPVFAAMFQHNMQESITGQVMIQDIEKDIFYQLLHFIYSGRISDPLTESTAQQLLAAADKYDMPHLKFECAKSLLPHVNELTVRKMFDMAVAYNVENLKEECERFLIDEMSIYQLLDLIIWADLHSAEKVKEAALNCARKNSAILFRCYNYEYEKLMRPFLKATRRRMTI